MASTSADAPNSISPVVVKDIRKLLWGKDIAEDVFRRWAQGFSFSEDEPTALLQLAGGPCSVIAPLQAFLLKNLLFRTPAVPAHWDSVTAAEQTTLLIRSLEDLLSMVRSAGEPYCLLYHGTEPGEGRRGEQQQEEEEEEEEARGEEEGESAGKKLRLGHEQFHSGLRCQRCRSVEELRAALRFHLAAYEGQYGVLLLLYSVILTKGLEQIRREVEDPSEPLIAGVYGHGSQSLINLLVTGKAVSNVWDNDKDISGLKLCGVQSQATIGFLTLLEHHRYCEVGWYLKNPQHSIWLLGSETHITVLFSEDRSLVLTESPEAAARRIFNGFDSEGNGFISADMLGQLLQSLDLVSDEEYVKIMYERMDPEQLGIVTLNAFLDEFFPTDSHKAAEQVQSFTVYHYNGLRNSCPAHKVKYRMGTATIMEYPEVQIITDTSPIKMCLLTKWPTIEMKWSDSLIPSLN